MKAFYILLTAILFYPALSFSQFFTIDTLRDESPYNKEFAFIFPVLKSTAKPDIAIAISNELISDVLKIEPGTQHRSLFENIWGKKEMDIPEVSDISYKVINNDADFFCISISATSCDGACDSWTKYFIYESATGKKLSLGDLFVGRGIDYISDSVSAMRAKRIDIYTDTLKNALSNKPLSDDDKRDYKNAIDAYVKCSQQHQISPVFSIDKKTLTIHTGHCLPYDLQFMDKVDHDFIFSLKDLQSYLTDYGKSLLKL